MKLGKLIVDDINIVADKKLWNANEETNNE